MRVPKYRIYYDSNTLYWIEIEAVSIKEAREIAKNTDGGDFSENGVGDWEPCTLLDEEVNENG